MKNIRVYADGELSEVAGTFVCVQKLVDALGIVGSGFDDFTVLDFEADVFLGEALLLAEGIVGNNTVH